MVALLLVVTLIKKVKISWLVLIKEHSTLITEEVPVLPMLTCPGSGE
jgi:hypothetical protein